MTSKIAVLVVVWMLCYLLVAFLTWDPAWIWDVPASGWHRIDLFVITMFAFFMGALA